MILTSKKILAVNFTVSFITFVIIFMFKEYILQTLFNFLFAINKPLSSLTINPLDIMILSFIPVWVYPIYSKNKNISIRQITLTNLSALLLIILACVIAFIAIDIFVKPYTVLIPDYVVIMPFSFFLTLVLISGMSLTFAVFFLLKLARKNELSPESGAKLKE